MLFGYTHSYFHADLATVGDAVVFLRTLLPGKPVDEIYTVLGRAKQGKTERYRHFFSHLAAHPEQALVHAEGERGMVMAVFTLPSYPLVFKLIRDQFALSRRTAPASMSEEVPLVFKHDRVGRLIDAQEYRHLRFPRAQFAPELLRRVAGRVQRVGQRRRRRHRRAPLLRRAPPAAAEPVREGSRREDVALAAMLDYGQAIKDLARSNIFPGDLLLKNFGVTRHGRAIFYDYDELCLVSDAASARCPSRATTKKRCTTAPGITWPTTMCSRNSSRASSA